MKQPLITLAHRLHRLVFRREMSSTMAEFLSHTVWSFAGVFFNASVFFVLNVVAGRLLGPAGYGSYSLAAAIAVTVVPLMSAGFDVTAIKYIAEFSNQKEKDATMSNSLRFVLPFAALVLATLALLREPLARLVHADARLILLALVFSLATTYKNLFDGFLKAYKRFPLQAGTKIAEAAVAFFAFTLLILVLGHRGYADYLSALIIGCAVSAGLAFLALRRRIGPWSAAIFAKERHYLGVFIAFSAVGLVLNGIDRFFIAHYLGTTALGIYGVYLLSATVIVAQGILVVNNVFFPMANQVADKRQLMATLDRFLAIAAVPSLLVISGLSYVVVLLFGRAYGVHWDYIALVSLIAYAQIVSSMYNSVLGSSPELFRKSTSIYYLKPLFAIVMYSGIERLGLISIPAVLTVLLASYLFDAVNAKLTFRLVQA